MIDYRAARAKLAAVVGASVGDRATVYPWGLSATAALPAVVLGMPRWEPNTQPCIDTVTFPVSVAVRRTGPDEAVIDTLEELWPVTAEALRDAAQLDQTLGGVCKAATVTRADPGFLSVQGQEFPCQVIIIELYG